MKTYEVVRTIDLEAIDAGEAQESFKFRIEVLRDLGQSESFFVRIYRRETFRIQPTFPLEESGPHNDLADHEFFIIDDAIEAEEIVGNNLLLVTEEALKAIKKCFA